MNGRSKTTKCKAKLVVYKSQWLWWWWWQNCGGDHGGGGGSGADSSNEMSMIGQLLID